MHSTSGHQLQDPKVIALVVKSPFFSSAKEQTDSFGGERLHLEDEDHPEGDRVHNFMAFTCASGAVKEDVAQFGRGLVR